MPSQLRQQVRAREPTVGTWVSLPEPAIAEVNAHLGFDFVLADTEHTPTTLETVAGIARAVDAVDGPTETVVRVPWNDPVRIKRVLDIGVEGVMVPMVDDADAAAAFVEATRYPPDGIRGIATSRAADYGLDFEDYVARANEEVITIAQIETGDGIENVEGIAAVEGLDALFVGPADLSAAIGAFGEWESDAFEEAVGRVLDGAHAADVPVGTIATSPGEIETWVERGVDFVIAGIDTGHLIAGGERVRAAYHDAIDGGTAE